MPSPPFPVDPLITDLVGRCTFPPPGTPLVCAVSGGPDSLALLVLAAAAGCEVTAVHIDHGLRSGSAPEADVVAAAADRYRTGFRSERVVVADGPNLEARARAARFAMLGPGAATGHTADDQAETVLVNLLRGAGVDGLAAMRAGPSHPLLPIRRSETLALCDDQGLDPVRDPMNDDPRFLRNRIRAELLPLCSALAGRDVVPILARQAGLLAGDADVLAAVVAMVDPTDAAGIAAIPEPVSRRVIRAWLTGDSPYPPSLDAVERVMKVARGQRRAAQVQGGTRVARSRGRLSKTTMESAKADLNAATATGCSAGATLHAVPPRPDAAGRWTPDQTGTVGP